MVLVLQNPYSLNLGCAEHRSEVVWLDYREVRIFRTVLRIKLVHYAAMLHNIIAACPRDTSTAGAFCHYIDNFISYHYLPRVIHRKGVSY